MKSSTNYTHGRMKTCKRKNKRNRKDTFVFISLLYTPGPRVFFSCFPPIIPRQYTILYSTRPIIQFNFDWNTSFYLSSSGTCIILYYIILLEEKETKNTISRRVSLYFGSDKNQMNICTSPSILSM